jgi:hypothetical protein
MAVTGRPRKRGEKKLPYTFSLKASTVKEVERVLELTSNEDMSLSQFVEALLLKIIKNPLVKELDRTNERFEKAAEGSWKKFFSVFDALENNKYHICRLVDPDNYLLLGWRVIDVKTKGKPFVDLPIDFDFDLPENIEKYSIPQSYTPVHKYPEWQEFPKKGK